MAFRSQTAVVLLQTALLLATVPLISALPQTIPLPNVVDKAVTQGSSEGNAIAESYQTPGVGDHIPGSCGFHGNPDVYGLGIRIGIYGALFLLLNIRSKKLANM